MYSGVRRNYSNNNLKYKFNSLLSNTYTTKSIVIKQTRVMIDTKKKIDIFNLFLIKGKLHI